MSGTTLGIIGIVGALIALMSLLLRLLEGSFHGFGPRFFAGARGALGVVVAFAGVLAWSASPAVTVTSCEVVAATRAAGDASTGDQAIRVRLRWQAGGTTYTNPQPFALPGAPERLHTEDGLRPGSRMPCHYRNERPGHIYAGPYRADTTTQRTIALCLLLGGLYLLVVGIRRWRRGGGKARRHSLWRGTSGAAGLMLLALTVVGLLIATETNRPWTGYALLAIGIVGFLALIIHEIRAQDRVFQDIERRLRENQYWPRTEDLPERRRRDTEDGVDPWQDQRVKGLWQGVPVRVAMTATGAIAQIELPDWPTELLLESPPPTPPDGRSERAVTGDTGFDKVLGIDGPDAIWRLWLGPDVRRALVDCTAAGGRILGQHQLLEFSVDVAGLDELAAYLDRGVKLAETLPTPRRDGEPGAWLFESLEREPDTRVRLGHYRWLYAEGWQVTRLVRAATSDSAPAIRDWAAQHLPPSVGAFR